MKESEIHNSVMHERLKRICDDFSQSQLARSTGFLQSNISRYLKGRKFPAEFCAALVEKLGVNPTWLLSGEGAVYLTDIATPTAEAASDLLSLVQSMKVVSRMKLGNLAGNDHAKVLRDLDFALKSYQDLRGKINNYTAGVFSDLLNSFRQAIEENNRSSADTLEESLSQLSRICDDSDLLYEYDSLCTRYSLNQGNPTKALVHGKQVFTKSLTRSENANQEHVKTIADFITSMSRFGRCTEAKRICLSYRELISKSRPDRAYSTFTFIEATIDFALGNHMPSIISRICDTNQVIYEDYIDDHKMYVLLTNLWAGTSSEEELLSIGERLASNKTPLGNRILRGLTFFPPTPSNISTLTKAAKLYVNRKLNISPPDPYLDLRVACFQRVLEHGDKEAVYEFASSPLKNKRPYLGELQSGVEATLISELAWLANDFELAKSELKKADRNLRLLPDELSLPIHTHARHYHNVLRIVPKNSKSKPMIEIRTQAVKFFEEKINLGYRSLVELI